MMKRESKVLIEELIKGINALKPEDKGAWGKMNVSEMLLHCSRFIDLYLGEISVPSWYKLVYPLVDCFYGTFLNWTP